MGHHCSDTRYSTAKIQVVAAYGVLGDPLKRKRYDEDGSTDSMMPEEPEMPEEHPDPSGTPVPCQTLHLRQDPIRKAKDLLFSREEIVREKLAAAKNIKEAMDARKLGCIIF